VFDIVFEQFGGSLLDDLAGMRQDKHAPPHMLRGLDDVGGDDGLAGAGRRDHDDAALAGTDDLIHFG